MDESYNKRMIREEIEGYFDQAAKQVEDFQASSPNNDGLMPASGEVADSALAEGVMRETGRNVQAVQVRRCMP